MLKITEIQVPGFEKVVEAQDSSSGLHCFIVIHSTVLGPAMGGTRIYPYQSREDALNDGLRLAKAMTYKSALAETGLGGGKAVIIANPKTQKTEQLLLSFGRVLDSLKGQFITAEDVGSTPEDMAVIRKETVYVGALKTEKSSGDPSRFTAWGISRGILAVAKTLWKKPDIRKKVIAIQGLGNVGTRLAETLFWEGASLIITDIDPAVAHQQSLLYGALVVDPKEFMKVQCDILSPCALGGMINKESISTIRCKAVAGGANNQLQKAEDGVLLKSKGILYAPDYVINAGGIINASLEYDPEGYNPIVARDKVNQIYDTLLEVFDIADKEKKPTSLVADELAEYKIRHKIGKRRFPLKFH